MMAVFPYVAQFLIAHADLQRYRAVPVRHAWAAGAIYCTAHREAARMRGVRGLGKPPDVESRV